MKQLLTGVCLTAFIVSSILPQNVWADAVNNSVQVNKNVEKNTVKSEGSPTPVTQKAKKGLDYSSGSGSKGTKAATADTALTAVSAGVAALSLLSKFSRSIREWGITQGISAVTSFSLTAPLVFENSWFPLFISLNPYEAILQLGHAAVNQFMRDETYITASFTGAQGHVTDKWVGPPAKNKTFKVLGEFNVPTQRFAAVAFDANEYKNLKEVDDASARELMKYRNEQLIEDQRSLKNVTAETWGLHYRAQQRSINAMATALQLKELLTALASADARVSGEYGSKTQAVASVAARRVLYDSLMYLKMNVMAARTKMRSEAMELDLKPVTKDPEGAGERRESGVTS